MSIERVIIDSDPGIDDCMAILLALASPELKVEAITLTHGNNNDMDIMARNAAYMFQLAGKEGLIYKGCTSALQGSPGESDGPRIHGLNGLGNIPDPEVEEKYLNMIQEGEAADFLIQYCKENAGEISIITLGPLSNLGTAIQRDPDFPGYVKRISSMGGCFNAIGNISPLAEANFYNDCHAAKIVTNAPWKDYTMAPLNTTRTVKLDTEFRENLRNLGHIGSFIYDISSHYVDFLSNKFGMETIPVHDSSAVMYMIAPEVFTNSSIGYVDVETNAERANGMTILDTSGYYKNTPTFENKTRVLFAANETAFKNVYLDRIRSLHE